MSNFDINPQVNAKAKKNLLWVAIFSITMIFAGFTSAYIVSNGSEFWVKIKLPQAFIYSTVVIVLSSISIFLAQRFIKKGKTGPVKLFMGLAFVLGSLFGYFQYQGWLKLFAQGNAVSSHIINQSGRYGQYFSLAYQSKEITYDGYDFYWSGDTLSTALKTEMKSFCQELMNGAATRDTKHNYNLKDYGTGFVLKYENQPVGYFNGQLAISGIEMSKVQNERLLRFSECIVNNRGDFMLTGRYGVDFTIRYKGKELEYKNRSFFLDNKRLSAKQENDLQGSKNKSSSYIYVFTFMHLLHWIGGIIALLVIWIRSIQVRYTAENYLGIQLGSIYWHFLGILWIYLYAFLIFIH